MTAEASPSIWRPIVEAERSVGPLLLRDGTGSLDPVYVGRQEDDGRWFFGDLETKPLYFALIPPFDCEDAE
ncbi:hypothetical protein [Bradyrhizobium japonicum]|uniref:hypothetical protein n=1 Tax=Bradyrhizobium japonicum TaxID=375 RepID=UPI00117FD05B|nr:hypothetical protein [Bradyrhizobium japonicum]